MAREVFAIIGSGTIPYTRGILPAAQRGTESTGEGIRGGTRPAGSGGRSAARRGRRRPCGGGGGGGGRRSRDDV